MGAEGEQGRDCCENSSKRGARRQGEGQAAGVVARLVVERPVPVVLLASLVEAVG